MHRPRGSRPTRDAMNGKKRVNCTENHSLQSLSAHTSLFSLCSRSFARSFASIPPILSFLLCFALPHSLVLCFAPSNRSSSPHRPHPDQHSLIPHHLTTTSNCSPPPLSTSLVVSLPPSRHDTIQLVNTPMFRNKQQIPAV